MIGNREMNGWIHVLGTGCPPSSSSSLSRRTKRNEEEDEEAKKESDQAAEIEREAKEEKKQEEAKWPIRCQLFLVVACLLPAGGRGWVSDGGTAEVIGGMRRLAAPSRHFWTVGNPLLLGDPPFLFSSLSLSIIRGWGGSIIDGFWRE